MSAYYDKDRGRWVFEFNKVINGSRVRASKTLPQGWNRAKAEAYNKAETDRLYGIATGATKERALITEAVAAYIKHHCPKLKNGAGVIHELANMHWVYDGRYLDELAEVGREFVEAERERLQPASIKNRLSYLRAACRYAQKHHGMAIGDALNVSMPAVRNERKFYPGRDVMLKIARRVENRHARAIIRIGFYSGMRISEIVSLGVVDGAFLLTDTKNGEDRMVPIHPRLNVLLRYLPMPYKKRWLQRLWERARDAAGQQHLHFHDLRHSTASQMINSGVSLHTVGAVLGHKDQLSTQRYSHLAQATLQDAIRKIR